MMPLARKLASLKLTFAGLCVLAINAALISRWPGAMTWLVLPLGLLSLNLLAAILVNRAFRSQAALLLFHVGLLCVLLLTGAGLLLRFDGNVEIVEGADFDPDQVSVRNRGWLHSGRLAQVRFTQGSIAVRYRGGLQRDTTHTRVDLPGGGSVDFGDREGLRAQGYRFLTTFNKGYSLLLLWEGADGRRSLGAVNFPSYPDLEWKQVNEWKTPAGESLRLELVLADPVPQGEPWVLASDDTRYRLAVTRGGDALMQLEEGDGFDVAGGRVQVRDLRLWMGYRIDYNPVLPWLVVAAFLSLGALAAHVHLKFRSPARRVAAAVVGGRQAA